jgi:hypothetical protein
MAHLTIYLHADGSTTGTDSDIDLPEPEDEEQGAKQAHKKAAVSDDKSAFLEDDDGKKGKRVYVDKQAGMTKGLDMGATIAGALAKRSTRTAVVNTSTAGTVKTAESAALETAVRSLRAKTSERSAEAEVSTF